MRFGDALPRPFHLCSCPGSDQQFSPAPPSSVIAIECRTMIYEWPSACQWEGHDSEAFHGGKYISTLAGLQNPIHFPPLPVVPRK